MGRNNFIYRLDPACNSVVVCRNGNPLAMSCRSGYSYDASTGRCQLAAYARW